MLDNLAAVSVRPLTLREQGDDDEAHDAEVAYSVAYSDMLKAVQAGDLSRSVSAGVYGDRAYSQALWDALDSDELLAQAAALIAQATHSTDTALRLQAYALAVRLAQTHAGYSA
jgi:hypothetical protein